MSICRNYFTIISTYATFLTRAYSQSSIKSTYNSLGDDFYVDQTCLASASTEKKKKIYLDLTSSNEIHTDAFLTVL